MATLEQQGIQEGVHAGGLVGAQAAEAGTGTHLVDGVDGFLRDAATLADGSLGVEQQDVGPAGELDVVGLVLVAGLLMRVLVDDEAVPEVTDFLAADPAHAVVVSAVHDNVAAQVTLLVGIPESGIHIPALAPRVGAGSLGVPVGVAVRISVVAGKVGVGDVEIPGVEVALAVGTGRAGSHGDLHDILAGEVVLGAELLDVRVAAVAGVGEEFVAAGELALQVIGLLVPAGHVAALVEAVAHQQITGIVSRVAAFLALLLRSVLGGIVEVVVDPLGDLVEGRTLELALDLLVTDLGRIEDEGERSVDVQQVVHHQATADTGLGLELLLLGSGQGFLVGIAEVTDDLGEIGDVAQALEVGGGAAVVAAALGLVVGEGALVHLEPVVAPVQVQAGKAGIGGAVEDAPDRAFTTVEVVLLAGNRVGPLDGVGRIAEHQLGLEVRLGSREVGRGEGAVDLRIEVLLAGSEREQGGDRHQGNKYLFHFL